MNTYQKGKKGEEVAIEYLQKIGYRVIATNYRHKGAEIDILALDKYELVVVEVKSGREIAGYLSEKVPTVKRAKIESALDAYVFGTRMVHFPVRFEIIAVAFPETKIYHYREEFFD